MSSQILNHIAIAILVASVVLSTSSHAQPPEPFVCMYGHSDDAGVTEHFRKLIPRLNVIEGTSSNVAYKPALRNGRSAAVTNTDCNMPQRQIAEDGQTSAACRFIQV